MNTLPLRIARNTSLISTGLAAVGYAIWFVLELEDWLALTTGPLDQRRAYAQRIMNDELTPYSPGLQLVARMRQGQNNLSVQLRQTT